LKNVPGVIGGIHANRQFPTGRSVRLSVRHPPGTEPLAEGATILRAFATAEAAAVLLALQEMLATAPSGT